MALFQQQVTVPVSVAEAFAWHERPGAFARLQPPWEAVEILAVDEGLEVGAKVRVRLRLFGPLRMTAEFHYTQYQKNVVFVDEQVRGPFRQWRHEHRFVALNGGRSCRLEDIIHYRAPIGTEAIVRRKLRRMFEYRQRIFRADMEDLAKRPTPEVKTILITGGTGFIGSALIARLQTLGHTVRTLSRKSKPNAGQFLWDPEKGTWDPAAFVGVDTLIHLAGAPIAKRWNAATRSQILTSRIASTRLLVRAVEASSAKPLRIVQASGINFYGYDLAAKATENTPSGGGFLADVCRQWESAAADFSANGHTVALLRTGVVLGPRGGALAKMLPIFKAGLGGSIGLGKRMFPWIGLEDLVEMYVFLADRPELCGAFNAVAPDNIDNATFSRTLGKTLRRPAILPVPPIALRLALGEMARETLLCNVCATPMRLQEAGFIFRHSTIAKALTAMLNPSCSQEPATNF
jgi:uncharacterized protein (TIGR01777 family)